MSGFVEYRFPRAINEGKPPGAIRFVCLGVIVMLAFIVMGVVTAVGMAWDWMWRRR